WTTSRCTGSPAPRPRPRACTGRARGLPPRPWPPGSCRPRSRSRSPSRSFPARSSGPRAAGRRRSTPTSVTSTRRAGAATSRRGRSRICSPPSSARPSGPFASAQPTGQEGEGAAVMSVVVIVTAFPDPARRAEVIAAFEAAITEVHSEPGVELYALHEGPGRLVMIEKYESDQVRSAHLQSAALAGLRAALEGKLSRPLDAQLLVPHPAGQPGKG